MLGSVRFTSLASKGRIAGPVFAVAMLFAPLVAQAQTPLKNILVPKSVPNAPPSQPATLTKEQAAERAKALLAEKRKLEAAERALEKRLMPLESLATKQPLTPEQQAQHAALLREKIGLMTQASRLDAEQAMLLRHEEQQLAQQARELADRMAVLNARRGKALHEINRLSEMNAQRALDRQWSEMIQRMAVLRADEEKLKASLKGLPLQDARARIVPLEQAKQKLRQESGSIQEAKGQRLGQREAYLTESEKTPGAILARLEQAKKRQPLSKLQVEELSLAMQWRTGILRERQSLAVSRQQLDAEKKLIAALLPLPAGFLRPGGPMPTRVVLTPGMLIKSPDSQTVYLVGSQREKHPFANLTVLNGCGLNSADVRTVSPETVNAAAAGGPLATPHDCRTVRQRIAVEAANQKAAASAASRTGAWQLLPGSARALAVGANGALWVIGTNKVSGGYGIYRWNGRGWDGIPGGAVEIAVDAQGNAWVANDAQQIWRWTGRTWSGVPGRAIALAASRSGIYHIGNDPQPGGVGNGIYRWNGNGWTKLPGAGVRIAANDTSVFVMARDGSMYVFGVTPTGAVSASRKLPGVAKDIGIGANGRMWHVGTNAVNGGFGVYYWTGNGWAGAPGGLVRIAVGPNGMPFGVNSAGQIWRMQ